jgi:pimeloyl-ACP methyl ester carboxylesterase
MKYHLTSKALTFYGFLVFLLLFLVVSCNKENDDQGNDTYLVDYTANYTYSLQTVQSFLSLLTDQYPEANSIKDNAQYSVQVYTIHYKTHYLDSLITASGLVCMPVADEAFPVISFQNGTNTAHDNAPTEDLFDQSYILLEIMASNGYIILIPDYIGFGSSESILHPYYHRTTTNNAVIDMMHAFNEMQVNNDILAGSNDKTYLMGYSQGGWATLSVLDEIENGEETGINVAATSCGAGAYDLTAMANYIFNVGTYPGPLYLPYFLYSEMDLGLLTDPLDRYFKSPYAERIPQLFNGSYSNDEVDAQLTDQISDLVTDALIDNFETGQDFSKLRELLVENSVTAWNTDAKIRFYHGTEDLTVPPEQSSAMYNDFIVAGADADKVGFYELNGMDHGSGLLPWGILTLNWFNAIKDNK